MVPADQRRDRVVERSGAGVAAASVAATARRKLADALSDATATDEVLLSVAASEVALYEQELQLEARLLRALAVSAQPADVIAACIVWREQPQLSEDEIDVLYARRAAIAVR